MPSPELLNLARAAAAKHSLDFELVCAVCEQESAWDPWAIRYESGFFSKYIAPLFAASKIVPSTFTEAYSRSISWGLMQEMGENAREDGFTGPFLSQLADPATGLEWGCKRLAHLLGNQEGNYERTLLAWNGGGNKAYPGEVIARMEHYAGI